MKHSVIWLIDLSETQAVKCESTIYKIYGVYGWVRMPVLKWGLAVHVIGPLGFLETKAYENVCVWEWPPSDPRTFEN